MTWTMAAMITVTVMGSAKTRTTMPGVRPHKQIEQKSKALLDHALQAGDVRVASALRLYRRLSKKEQHRLVRFVVTHRAEELKATYESVRAVASGYREWTNTREQQYIKTAEPAIVFEVHRKWTEAPKSNATESKRLPNLIMTHAWDVRAKEHRLCAIPTDVRQRKTGATPQARSRIRVLNSGGGANKGVVTCKIGVHRPGATAQRYALSCSHVVWHKNAGVRPNVLLARPPASGVGKGDPAWRGLIKPGSDGPSLDASLIRVLNVDLPALDIALAGVRPTIVREDVDQIPEIAQVWAVRDDGRTHRIRVRSPEIFRPSDIMNYRIPGAYHRCLVHWDFADLYNRTEGGDSGSPVLGANGRILLGIHLGMTNTQSIMLPIGLALTEAYYERRDRRASLRVALE